MTTKPIIHPCINEHDHELVIHAYDPSEQIAKYGIAEYLMDARIYIYKKEENTT